MYSLPMQAVLGAQMARQSGLKLGDTFTGSYGLAPGGHAHGQNPYTVTGILAPGGTLLDQLVFTPLELVWQVHETDTALDDDDREVMQAEREVTLALIQYKTPLAAVTFPRFVNTTTEMQAAAPALEITRLLSRLGVGLDVMRALATAKCLESGKKAAVCEKDLQAACKGLAIGKYCGMKHGH